MLETDPQDVCGETRVPRTIVLCFDGTAGQFDGKNTNVVRFCGLLRKDRPEEQLCYYQAGVGTYFAPGLVSPLFTWFARMLDEAIAWYLDAHVMDGYKYLMDNYRPGDKVCLFGFSRGAYTARALAGMLTKVGLLPKDNLEQIPFAYKAYKRTDNSDIELAAGFKKTFCQDVKVDFMGVWDTVQSTGLLVNRSLPFTGCNTAVRVFRHALSLDEHRAKFRPNLYHRPESSVKKASRLTGLKDAAISKVETAKMALGSRTKTTKKDGSSLTEVVRYDTCSKGSGLDVGGPAMVTQSQPDELSQGTDFVTDVLEVWFAGCHSDIGGGNVADGVDNSLAQITLRWMVEQVIESQCGILFDDDGLAQIGVTVPSNASLNRTKGGVLVPAVSPTQDLHPDSKVVNVVIAPTPGSTPDPSHTPTRPPSESAPERSECIAPLYDELQISKAWWLLEIIPLPFAWQDANGAWHKEWSIHLGKGRVIPYQQPKFHHSVKERMDYKPLKYSPRAIYDHDPIFV